MAPDDRIVLSSGYAAPEVFPKGQLAECAAHVLNELGDTALQYAPRAGLPILKDLLVEWLAEDGLPGVSSDHLAILTGAKQGLDLASRALAQPGDTIFASSPTYMNGLKIFRAAGLHPEGIPCDQEGLDTDALESELGQRSRNGELPAFIYTIPDFHNPTGAVMSVRRRAHLAELAAQYGIWVVEDNPYRFLRIDGQPLPPLKSFDDGNRVISIGSFAKILGPGLRVAWMVADPIVLDQLLVFKADSGTSPLAQLLIETYFRTVALKTHLEHSTAIYRTKRDAMDSALVEFMPEGVAWQVPDGGYYIWLTARGFDSERLSVDVEARGVKVYSGASFFPHFWDSSNTPPKDANIRLAFAYEPPDRIVAGIHTLAELMKESST